MFAHILIIWPEIISYIGFYVLYRPTPGVNRKCHVKSVSVISEPNAILADVY